MSIFYNQETKKEKVGNIIIVVVLGILFLIGVFSIMGPIYGVWSAKKHGEAELARANQNRQITVTEAEAANIAANSQAEAKIKQATAMATAEVERAKGVAEANKIIGDSLKGNEDYLRYLYITGLAEHSGQIIYVPTEGGLPLLEAGRAVK